MLKKTQETRSLGFFSTLWIVLNLQKMVEFKLISLLYWSSICINNIINILFLELNILNITLLS